LQTTEFPLCRFFVMYASTDKLVLKTIKANFSKSSPLFIIVSNYYFIACCTATATATVAPTIGSVATKPPFFNGRFGGNVKIVTTQWRVRQKKGHNAKLCPII
jgi:hypothetical protein